MQARTLASRYLFRHSGICLCFAPGNQCSLWYRNICSCYSKVGSLCQFRVELTRRNTADWSETSFAISITPHPHPRTPFSTTRTGKASEVLSFDGKLHKSVKMQAPSICFYSLGESLVSSMKYIKRPHYVYWTRNYSSVPRKMYKNKQGYNFFFLNHNNQKGSNRWRRRLVE